MWRKGREEKKKEREREKTEEMVQGVPRSARKKIQDGKGKDRNRKTEGGGQGTGVPPLGRKKSKGTEKAEDRVHGTRVRKGKE